MRTVSVLDQFSKGLKGVLIQETFYGVEKGTDTKMILEPGNFYCPRSNRRKPNQGESTARRRGTVEGVLSTLEMGLLLLEG